jgi:ABC-type multidrug transport system fused ATPase/permease subunit
MTLSGGQRQRLAIARAILRDAPILIFDEATSQIDTESEAKIQDALRAFASGRTTFVVAHRLSTIKFADRIVVLDEGQIIDTGKHEDLLDRCPLYQVLCQTQLVQ